MIELEDLLQQSRNRADLTTHNQQPGIDNNTAQSPAKTPTEAVEALPSADDVESHLELMWQKDVAQKGMSQNAEETSNTAMQETLVSGDTAAAYAVQLKAAQHVMEELKQQLVNSLNCYVTRVKELEDEKVAIQKDHDVQLASPHPDTSRLIMLEKQHEGLSAQLNQLETLFNATNVELDEHRDQVPSCSLNSQRCCLVHHQFLCAKLPVVFSAGL